MCTRIYGSCLMTINVLGKAPLPEFLYGSIARVRSVLQEDEWFLSAAQEAVRRLLEGWNQQVTSPTASISAQSVSSFRSHGSE